MDVDYGPDYGPAHASTLILVASMTPRVTILVLSSEGMPLCPLGLWKLSKRRVRFSSLLTLIGEFPCLSAMAKPIAINGAWLQLLVLEQIQQGVGYRLYRWCPEVHLITEATLCKMIHLASKLIWLILFEEPQFVLSLPQRSPAP